MNAVFDSNNYLIVDKFISLEEAESLYKEFVVLPNVDPGIRDFQCPLSHAYYNHKPFLVLLNYKVAMLSDILNEKLLPTYCYARVYNHGEELKKHSDRPSCEISVTLNLGGDADWEIYITKPDGESVGVNLKPGQAMVYKGTVAEHWRNKFTGNKYAQVFLHYIRAYGEHAEHYYDRIETGRS